MPGTFVCWPTSAIGSPRPETNLFRLIRRHLFPHQMLSGLAEGSGNIRDRLVLT
jgi:hypothetical protein